MPDTMGPDFTLSAAYASSPQAEAKGPEGAHTG